MTWLGFFTFLWLHSASAQTLPGQNLALKSEQIRFTYRSFDGSRVVPCQHQIYNAPAQDWRVNCGDKNYLVHLWVTVYRRAQEPRTSFEILYWLTDFTHPQKPESSGSTIWFHMRGESSLHSMTMSQSVDRDYAGLYLDLAALSR